MIQILVPLFLVMLAVFIALDASEMFKQREVNRSAEQYSAEQQKTVALGTNGKTKKQIAPVSQSQHPSLNNFKYFTAATKDTKGAATIELTQDFFEPGSVDLSIQGRQQILALAKSIKELQAREQMTVLLPITKSQDPDAISLRTAVMVEAISQWSPDLRKLQIRYDHRIERPQITIRRKV